MTPPVPYYHDEAAGITIYHGDARDVLPTLPAAGFLVTDPPFNVGKDYGTSQDDLPIDEYRAMLEAVVAAGPERQAWIAPTNRIAMYYALLPEAQPVIVRRGAQGPKRWGWFDQFDVILVRGHPRRYVSNLWDNIRLKGEGYFFRENTFDHPGYTPYPIIARLIELMTEPGELVIDPFCGTGTTARACKDLGRRCIAIEIEERYCEIAARRLQQSVLPLEIPA